MKNTVQIHALNKWQLIVFICSISIAILFLGYFFYSYEEDSIRKSRHNNIKAIADMKISQITQWQKERISNAKVISRSPHFMRAVKQWQQNKDNPHLKKEIIEQFSMAKTEYGYKEILLVSAKAELLLSLDPKQNLDAVTYPVIINAIQHQQITFTDFYLNSDDNKVNYDIIAPIIDNKQNPIAALVFRIDPNAYLYPLIQSWPTPSKTSETLLIRKEGDSVLFLNELRHQKNTALNLKIPLARKNVPAVQAALGFIGTIEGIDYRGVPVLSHVEPIPGTSWFMIAKVDKNEIYAELRFRALEIGIIAFVLILFVSVGLTLLYNFRQKKLYQELLHKEIELRAHQKEFKTTLFSIGDGVIKTDANGTIDFMNPVAEQMTGWKETEALGMPIEKVFRLINENTGRTTNNPVSRVLSERTIVGLYDSTLLISKEGKEIPIDDSSAPIKNESGEIIGIVLVFRDISKQKQAEKKLLETNARHSAMIENIGDVIAIIGIDGITKYQSPNIEKWFGWKPEDLIGTNGWDKMHPDDIERIQKEFSKMLENETASIVEYRFKCKDGIYKWIELTAINRINDPAINGVLLNYHDITERRQRKEMELIATKLKEEKKNAIQSIMDTIPGFAFIKDENLKYVAANHTLCDLVKIPYDQIAGKTDYDIFPPDIAAKYIADDTMVMKNKKPFYVEEITIDKNKKDKRFIVATRKIPRFDENENVCGIYGLGFDISELKEAQKELVESEKKLREAQEMAHLGFWSWDIKSGDVEWSKELYHIFGLDPDTFTPHIDSILALSPWPEDHNRNNELINRAIESHTPGHFEQKFLRPDKSIGYYYSTFQGKYDENGELYSMVGTVLDITERKRVEETLKEINTRHASMIANIGDVIAIIGADGVNKYQSPNIEKWFGWKPEDMLVGITWDYVHPEDVERIQNEFSKILKKETTSIFEFRFKCKDGTYKWIDMTAVNRINDPAINGVLLNYHDITDRKLAEQLIRQKNEFLQLILDSLSHPFYVINMSDYTVNIANSAAINGQLATGLTCHRLTHRRDIPCNTSDHPCPIEIIKKTKKAVILEHIHYDNDGNLINVEVHAHPIFDSKRNISQVIEYSIDITERKRTEEEIKLKNEQLLKVNAEKDKFFSIIAHDLRGPLGALMGFTELLVDELPNLSRDKIQESAILMRDSAANLFVFLENLLQWARQEQGLVPFNPELIQLLPVVNKSMAIVMEAAKTKNIEIDSDISGEIMVFADENMLETVIRNLVTNAVKFTPQKGKISLLARKTNENYIEIAIKDTGIGMDKKMVNNLFLISAKTNRLGTEGEPSTGLGLLLCKEFIEKHGGKIWVESKVNRGTTFYFSLPKKKIREMMSNDLKNNKLTNNMLIT